MADLRDQRPYFRGDDEHYHLWDRGLVWYPAASDSFSFSCCPFFACLLMGSNKIWSAKPHYCPCGFALDYVTEDSVGPRQTDQAGRVDPHRPRDDGVGRLLDLPRVL